MPLHHRGRTQPRLPIAALQLGGRASLITLVALVSILALATSCASIPREVKPALPPDTYDLPQFVGASDLIVVADPPVDVVEDGESKIVTLTVTHVWRGSDVGPRIVVAVPIEQRVFDKSGLWFLRAPATANTAYIVVGGTDEVFPLTVFSDRSLIRAMAGLPPSEPLLSVGQVEALFDEADIVAEVSLKPLGDGTTARVTRIGRVVKGPLPPSGSIPDGVPGAFTGDVVVSSPRLGELGGPWPFLHPFSNKDHAFGWVFLTGDWSNPTLINPIPPSDIFNVAAIANDR